MDIGALLGSLWDSFAPWLASTLVIVGTVGLLALTRFVLSRAGSDRRGVPYKRQIASTMIGLVGVFVAVIFLPIDSDVRSQILSLLGVLLSAVVAFSSTSLVGNAMAGVMMRLTKSYRPGDFVEVGEIVGRVTDQGLFHTEVQLITRDIVALPNLYLSRNPVHVTRSSGTFVAVDVSLGYEIPHQAVDDALASAVEQAGLEEPFVLVDALLDHAIRYRVHGLLKDTKELLSARSRLRRAVVNALHAADIQIVSPGYVNRVEFPADHEFIPPAPDNGEQQSEASSETSDKVEAIAFDRAEEAESIERLYALQEKLQRDREETASKIKEAESGDEKQRLQDEQQQIEARIKRTSEIVEQREEKREEREGEDESP